jgi:dCMP deaminase
MEKWDRRFLEMAKLVASWSKDPSTQTGAVIARSDKRVVSVGFNGFPQMMPDVEQHYAVREEKYSRIVHCEMNALLFAERSVTGCTLYTYPFISCDRCFVHMVQAGIIRFVAPRATADQLTRWGDAFERVKKYAIEMNVNVVEYE